MTGATIARWSALTLILVTTLLVSVFVGAADLSPGEVLAALLGQGDETTRTIVLNLRVPRAALAALVGACLALSGAVFQALLRNPLAEPYILGISGGSAVGAVTVIVLGLGVRLPWLLPLAAFAGAIVAMGVVLRIALGVGGALDTRVLLLAGVVVGAFFNAIILLLLNFADANTFRAAVFWMMGNLSGATWRSVSLLTAYLVPAALVLMALARPFNLIAVGEDTALYLGVRVGTVRLVAYLTTSLLVAASVAVSGVIGFVGLIVPHGLRLIWGSDHRMLLPASMLAGASFLMLTDTVARTIAAPAELPTGVVTALAGVPVFVMLLMRSTK
ncbi:MAG: iron ABC transporter permease [Gemmatimonadales bacterium]